MRLSIIFFILLALSRSFSVAQLINIEAKRKANQEGLQGFLSLSAGMQKSTINVISAENIVQLQYQRKQNTFLFVNNIAYMKVDSSSIINNGYQHFRHNYALGNGAVTSEAFVQNQYNSVRLLKNRFISGIGPRFRLYNKPDTFSIYLSSILMYEYEILTDDSTVTNLLRGDVILAIRFLKPRKFGITHTTYYQPDLMNMKDFRLSSETGLELFLSEKFSLKISVELAYDSDPPLGIPKLFHSLKNSLKYSF